ncbi:MAG: PIN domain-containing protein [Bacteroidota bacterium]
MIDEAKNKYVEELISSKNHIDKELSDLFRITNKKLQNPATDDLIDEEIENFNSLFERQITKLGIRKIPYPSVSHEELVKKALSRKKPFAEGGRGYRDALIWENIKALIQKQQTLLLEPVVIFISKNYKDFCDKDYNIHPDLIEDLNKFNIPISAIEIKPDIDTFINQYITPKLELLNNIKNKLRGGTIKGLHVKDNLSTFIFDFLDNREFDHDEIDFPQEYESPSVSGIHEDYVFTFDEVRQLTDNEVLISGSVEVTCTFDFFIYKSDYYLMNEEEMPTITDLNWNDHYFAASEDRVIKINFLLSTDGSFSQITSHELALSETH